MVSTASRRVWKAEATIALLRTSDMALEVTVMDEVNHTDFAPMLALQPNKMKF
jgi:hypothetical protein